MDAAITKILRQFEKRSTKETERMDKMEPVEMQQHLDEFLLSVGPATGELINLLVKQSKAKTIVEIGSSYGYSTVWLAEAARETGGKVISLEIHSGKQEHARASVRDAGLDGLVEFKLGDALESLAKLRGEIDFVLLDLWKNLYIPCFDLFYPKLNPGAFIAADNMTYPEATRRAAEKYRKHIRTKRHIDSVLLPVGSGIELSRYK
jgi:predicted O-methyltransferase YrrM